MHGVHIDLLSRQAESIGVPLNIVALPPSSNMNEYERIMSYAIGEIKSMGTCRFVLFAKIGLVQL